MSGDAGMDGLDALMAELSASKLPTDSPKSSRTRDTTPKGGGEKTAVVDGFDANGQLVLETPEMSPRAAEFVKRLRRFQMRVADPATRRDLNRRLAKKNSEADVTFQYYEQRPQLANYTIQSEISRMEYQVVPDEGGDPMSDVESIRQYYANHEHKDDMIWRVANQSLLAQLLDELQQSLAGTPEDIELCISIHNTSSLFRVDLQTRTVTAKTNFKVATVGVGKEPMLALAKLSGEISVNLRERTMRQEITDMRLEMVFDDVLDAAARSLAKGEKAGMLHTAGASSDSQTLTFLRDRLLNTGSTAVEVGGGLVSGVISVGGGMLSGITSMVKRQF